MNIGLSIACLCSAGHYSYHNDTANQGSQQTLNNLKEAFRGSPTTYTVLVPMCANLTQEVNRTKNFDAYSGLHLYQTHLYQIANVALLARWHVLYLLTQRSPIIRLQFRIFDAFLAPILMQFADVVLRLLKVE